MSWIFLLTLIHFNMDEPVMLCIIRKIASIFVIFGARVLFHHPCTMQYLRRVVSIYLSSIPIFQSNPMTRYLRCINDVIYSLTFNHHCRTSCIERASTPKKDKLINTISRVDITSIRIIISTRISIIISIIISFNHKTDSFS